MDFGKLPSVENVDFGLIVEPPENAAVLGGSPAEVPCVYLGATGYNMRPWVGAWYPPGARDRDYLRHYGLQFNTIEHNTTHYRVPDAATVARWYEEVPEDFRYCPKVPQSISHSADLGLNSGAVDFFCEALAGLGDKLGCCFIQLPPTFEPRQMRVLDQFLDRWPASIPLAVEVRHYLFFQPTPGAAYYFSALTDHGAAAVITDVAGRRDVCHMRLTAPRTLIRFVGNALHPTDYRRVDAWAERLAFWTDRGLREAYFFTHEPDNLLAPEMAAYAAAQFGKSMPRAVLRGPGKVGPPAQQGRLF